MRELKDGTYIIGVDHGYGNIKTANTVTPTGIQAYDTEPIFQGNVLEYGGKYYRFGEGHKNFIADKSEDDDFYILTLMAIARELQRAGIYKAKVHLAAGLPLTWIRVQRESFREYLMRNKNLKFRYNDKEYDVELVGCSIYPQGYSAVIDRLKDFTGTNIIADIGNGTMNVMYLVNKKPNDALCWTEKLGVNKCSRRIKNTIMDLYGVELTDSIVEEFLKRGDVDISEKYLKIFRETASQYSEKVFEALKNYGYKSELMKLYIIGGGGNVVGHFGKYDKNRVCINHDICAAAKGYETLAYLQPKKR